jgi:hypothetical protein
MGALRKWARRLGSSGQGKQRLGGEGNSVEEEEGEGYGPTGKSGPGLEPKVASTRDDALISKKRELCNSAT